MASGVFVRRRLRKQYRRSGVFCAQADTQTLFEYPLGKPSEVKLLNGPERMQVDRGS